MGLKGSGSFPEIPQAVRSARMNEPDQSGTGPVSQFQGSGTGNCVAFREPSPTCLVRFRTTGSWTGTFG